MLKINSRTSLVWVTLVSVLLVASSAFAKSNRTTIDLGSATNFGLLAGSGITNASAGTRITGDVGSSPTPAVTGLTASQVHGTLYLSSNPATAQAQTGRRPQGSRVVLRSNRRIGPRLLQSLSWSKEIRAHYLPHPNIGRPRVYQ